MPSKIAIIGSGNVGSALGRGLTRAGYEVQNSTEPDAKEKALWGELVILAVPFGALEAVVRQTQGALDGKVVVDVTNPLTSDMQLALGYSTSGAEELQKKLRCSRIVKCFNTVFAQHMDKGRLGDQHLSVFAAGENLETRQVVLGLACAIGFDAVDAGPLKNARWLEALGYLNIQLGYVLGLGTKIGFRLVQDNGVPRR